MENALNPFYETNIMNLLLFLLCKNVNLLSNSVSHSVPILMLTNKKNILLFFKIKPIVFKNNF